MTRPPPPPMDPELAATFERGRLAIIAAHDIAAAREVRDLEARLRAAVCEVATPEPDCDMGADGAPCDGCVVHERYVAAPKREPKGECQERSIFGELCGGKDGLCAGCSIAAKQAAHESAMRIWPAAEVTKDDETKEAAQ